MSRRCYEMIKEGLEEALSSIPEIGETDTGMQFKIPWDGNYLHSAFLDCLFFSLGTPDIMKQYRDETGDKFSPASTSEGRMIEAATGADLAFLERFSDWCADNVFGPPESLSDERDA